MDKRLPPDKQVKVGLYAGIEKYLGECRSSLLRQPGIFRTKHTSLTLGMCQGDAYKRAIRPLVAQSPLMKKANSMVSSPSTRVTTLLWSNHTCSGKPLDCLGH